MAGISDKALKTQYVQNHHRFSGKELQNGEFSDGASTDHSTFTFFGDIQNLAEGEYKWDGSKWVKK